MKKIEEIIEILKHEENPQNLTGMARYGINTEKCPLDCNRCVERTEWAKDDGQDQIKENQIRRAGIQ